MQRLNYIHQNPARQLIMQYLHEYLFCSADDYNEGIGLVKNYKNSGMNDKTYRSETNFSTALVANE